MKQYYMIIDVAKCENCNNCFLACKDEHCGNEWPGYAVSQPLHGHRWMNILRRERGRFPLIDVAYLPKPCMHCDDAPCINAAKDGAVYKRADGIVMIDPVKSRGQSSLAAACPYGAIWWNPDRRVPQKCTLCAHLLDRGWRYPRCVQACPTGALRIGYDTPQNLINLVREQDLEIIDKKYVVTKPRVYYRRLCQFSRCFIAGSVVSAVGKKTDCAAGTSVKLFKDGQMIDQKITDMFGDFKFDGLEQDSGDYRVEIDFSSFENRSINVNLGHSRVLGDICFDRGS